MTASRPAPEARAAAESCREWPENGERCGAPATAILWGKLFDPEALGPRCEEHASKWLSGRSTRAAHREGWAIYLLALPVSDSTPEPTDEAEPPTTREEQT